MSLAGKFVKKIFMSKVFSEVRDFEMNNICMFIDCDDFSDGGTEVNAMQYVLKHASNRPMPLLPSHFLSVCAQVQIIFIL